MTSVGLTAIVPTLDEERNLAACLDSLDFADHVIVIDSGSRDATRRIAREHGAVLIDRPFDGYGAQRNHAVAAADSDWVLCLDADERVPDALRREIRATLAAPAARGYLIPRHTWVAGHRIRRCGWQRDRVLRLYDRRHGAWDARLVHEKVVLDAPPGALHQPLHHHTARDLGALLAKTTRYAELGARELHRRGRRAGVAALALYPLARLFKMYLLRGGILDGVPGLIICAVAAHGVFLKYANLWQLDHAAEPAAPREGDA